MTDPVYMPNLKTSDSELRALKYLSPETRELILPAFELTRSRITTKNPEGSVFRRAEQLVETYGSPRFIVDLTTETDLMNEEMEGFFDEAGGYAKWRSFLSSALPAQIIPCLLYVDGGSEGEFKRQVVELAGTYGTVALRTSATERVDAARLYEWALDVIAARHVIVIGSLYFLEQGLAAVYLDRCSLFFRDVIGNQPPELLAFPGSSFPKAVGAGEYGDDEKGDFEAVEIPLFRELKRMLATAPLIYSDYSSVHPIRYPTRGGGWVPRVDIFQGGKFAYSRLRQPSGGYAAAARNIVRLYGASLPNCWGSDQIRSAANGAVLGRSPSFWISARINMWITQRTSELSSV